MEGELLTVCLDNWDTSIVIPMMDKIEADYCSLLDAWLFVRDMTHHSLCYSDVARCNPCPLDFERS